MVIAADGTKWSCASCLKGHRVSGCNHTDRELKLVPKKGRPVTQCHHCRLERKKRSAHVKCDCAEPDKAHHSKEKCIHLREAEERVKSSHYEDGVNSDKDTAHLAAVAEEQGCCCHHGGKCSCALLRKNSTDDETQPRMKHAPSKPRLEATRSDSSITVFANGHHKPIQRNHAAHECGMPYRVPIARSKTDQYSYPARRSVDNLGLSMNAGDNSIAVAPRSASAVSPAAMASLFGDAAGLTSNKLGVIDFGDINEVTADTPTRNNSVINSDENMGMVDRANLEDWASFSLEDLLSISGNDTLGLFNSNLDVNNLVQPALTAASSGTQSEIDEIPAIEDVYARGMPSIAEDVGFDQNSQSVNNPSQNNRRSLPPSFFGNVDFTVPDLDLEWQAQLPPFESNAKPTQDVAFNDPWQNTVPQVRNAYGNFGTTGRPASQSLGSSSAPNVDVLKQLFPDMEMDESMGPASPRTNAAYETAFTTASMDSLQIDAESLQNTVQRQIWQDGSMSIPNDVYASTFATTAYEDA